MANRPSVTGQAKTKSGKQIEGIRKLIAQNQQLYNQRRIEIDIAKQIVTQNELDQEILAKKKKELEGLLAVKQQYEATGQTMTDVDKEALKTLKDEISFLEAALVLDQETVNEKKEILKTASDITTEIQNQKNEINNIKNAEKERRAGLLRDIKEQTEYSDNLRSIGSSIGKNNSLYEALALKQDAMNVTLQSAFSIIDSMGDGNERLNAQANDAVYAYKDLQTSIASGQNALLQGKITQEEYNKQVVAASDYFDEIIKKINTGTKEGKELVNIFTAAKVETEQFAKAAKKSQEHFQTLDQVMDSFSGIPAMQELNKLLKTNINNTLAFRGAMMALGAAIGAAAYDYFGAGRIAQREIKLSAKIDRLDLQKDLIERSVKSGMNLTSPTLPIEDLEIGSGAKIQGIDRIEKQGLFGPVKPGKKRNFLEDQVGIDKLETQGRFVNETLPRLELEARNAGRRAGIQFSDQFQQGAAQFKATAKTARFGEQLEATGFNRGELQLAGIDPSQISDAMSQLAAQTGKVPTAKLGAEMALIAKRTGQSTENIASLAEYFKISGNLSSETAVNMVEGMRAMAVASNLDLGNLMEGVAESSKDALSYQIKSGEALAKQVAASQSIGVNFNKLAAAGRNMVLNYKDSIKAEMELSSMLGRNVSLTEVRAKAMSGDYAGMMNALKAQGLNPEDMNMQQQEALTKAVGGLDLESIRKIYRGEVKTPADLNAGNAAAAGSQFLGATKQAQAKLSADQASISANTAILSAKLENEIEIAFLDANQEQILRFNDYIQSLQDQLDLDIKDRAASTKAYLDVETKKKQETQKSEMGGTLEKAGWMLGASGLSIIAGLGLEKAKRMIFKTPAPTVAPRPGVSLTTTSGKSIQTGALKPTTTPAPKASALNSLKKFGKYGLAAYGGYKAIEFIFSKGGDKEKQQEQQQQQQYAAGFAQPMPEVKTEPSIDELRQQILQTQATNNVASGIQTSNDLLKEANSANNLSGICSCIASNMQQQMGMVVTELQNFKAANEMAQKISTAKADTINYTNEAYKAGATALPHLIGHAIPVVIDYGDKGLQTAKQKLGFKTAEKTEQLAVTESTEMVAKSGFKKVLEKASLKSIPQVANLSAKITKLANPVGWIGLGAEIGGGFLKELGKSKQSVAMYETGRATETAGNALAWGAMGATLGSFLLPGIGTIVGAAIGGGIGLLHGLQKNYFSAEAQKEAELVKQQEEQRIKAEELNAQIDYLIKIQEPGVAAAQKTLDQTNRMAKLAEDEPTWRNAMLLQTLEMTRLLSIIASDFVNTTQDGKLKDKLGNEVSIGNYDKTYKLQAEKGVLKYDNAREADIAKILGQFNANPGQKLKIGGEMLDMKGYMEKYKVSQKEIDIVTEKSQFMSMNQNVINQQKLNESGTKVTPAGGNTNTNAGGNTNTNAGGNTNTNIASLESLLTVLKTTQTNDDIRGKIIYGHLKDVISAYLGRIELRLMAPVDLMNAYLGRIELRLITPVDLMNATLTTISTDMALIRSYLEAENNTENRNPEINAILQKIQTEAHARGISMQTVEKEQLNKLTTDSANLHKVVLSQDAVKKNTNEIYANQTPALQNLEGINIAMLNALMDSSIILAGIEDNTRIQMQNGNSMKIELNAGALSNAIATVNSRKNAFGKSRRLPTKGG